MVAPWGGQIITRQMRCLACNTYFEAIREEFDGAPDQFDHVQEQFDRVQDVSEAASSWTTSSADDR